MATTSVEERLATLETEVTQLKKRLETDSPPAPSTPWWKQWFGVFKDNPDFDAAMERGAAYRRAQPTAADQAEEERGSRASA